MEEGPHEDAIKVTGDVFLEASNASLSCGTTNRKLEVAATISSKNLVADWWCVCNTLQ
jgi:hypothetical protein